MSATAHPSTELDRDVRRACARFAEEIGRLSGDIILREGVLRAAICSLTVALEAEFDGYQDILSREFLAHGAIIASNYDCAQAGGH